MATVTLSRYTPSLLKNWKRDVKSDLYEKAKVLLLHVPNVKWYVSLWMLSLGIYREGLSTRNGSVLKDVHVHVMHMLQLNWSMGRYRPTQRPPFPLPLLLPYFSPRKPSGQPSYILSSYVTYIFRGCFDMDFFNIPKQKMYSNRDKRLLLYIRLDNWHVHDLSWSQVPCA
jgi:hypothetical protein